VVVVVVVVSGAGATATVAGQVIFSHYSDESYSRKLKIFKTNSFCIC
jgi:hypothetical protein